MKSLSDNFTSSPVKDKADLRVNENFDLSPSGLIENLDLLTPIYLKTASYGHFGRENVGFIWEEAKDL